ncbi:MAG: NADH-dependent [FeFe] hydrogenase, group A6 [Candidatus Omnitrophica bacterium]|nr:NADH-dependent [FeFe] hydrogenase, group A6 [Candidatus Omnitrophota bacterium]
MVNITINGRQYTADEGKTILDACRAHGIRIPTLCYLEGVSEEAACSLCVVEVTGARTLVRSCVTKVTEGMDIKTATERVRQARTVVLELILANHPKDCLACYRNQNCELQSLAQELGIDSIRYPKIRKQDYDLDTSSPSIIRDANKCILCGRCIATCSKIQTVDAIQFSGRGLQSKVSTFMDAGLGKVACINCGQCVLICPTGALIERSAIKAVWKDIADPKKFVVVQTAPAIRAAIGEEFGLPEGVAVTGKMAAALRKLGFDKVFDTQFTADLTIIEEGSEFIDRVKNGGVLPMITSCSPGWIKFSEIFFPEILAHLSTCKSPQQMFGAVAKTYYAQKMGIDPRDMVVVSIMPCTAKKFEAGRPEMDSAFAYWREKMHLRGEESFPDVDYVLTTRETGRMITEAGIDFAALESEGYDDPLGKSTGAATLFGATGGVMEAALRSAYFYLTGQELPSLEFSPIRGLAGIKEATVNVAGMDVKVAVASGLGNARKLMEDVRDKKSPYHFIEIMACPGGCIGGGGQPIPTDTRLRTKRMEALYAEDQHLPQRRSHENSDVKALYDDFLKTPNGHLSHDLLHTQYRQRVY